MPALTRLTRLARRRGQQMLITMSQDSTFVARGKATSSRSSQLAMQRKSQLTKFVQGPSFRKSKDISLTHRWAWRTLRFLTCQSRGYGYRLANDLRRGANSRALRRRRWPHFRSKRLYDNAQHGRITRRENSASMKLSIEVTAGAQCLTAGEVDDRSGGGRSRPGLHARHTLSSTCVCLAHALSAGVLSPDISKQPDPVSLVHYRPALRTLKRQSSSDRIASPRGNMTTQPPNGAACSRPGSKPPPDPARGRRASSGTSTNGGR